jgi:plastocyanin
MVGYVVVKAKNAKIPTAKQDAQALKVQIKQAETSAKQDARIKPAKNSVALGSSDSSGVEDFAMFPATLTVKAGTTVTFAITKHSREVHTASFGPTSYLTAVSNSIQSPNTMQQAWYPSDDPSLGVPSVTPTSHGNGFVSTGVVDSDKTTTTIPSSGKLKFTTAGTYHFICLIHPFMHGTVVVTP